jgi:hypothetical protein
MKYIHTFWTKPLLEKSSSLCGHISKDEMPNFIGQKINLYKYSFLLLKKFSSNIELVTDKAGAKLLQFLPYSNIRTDLEDINNISSEFWAAPQVIGLSLYDEPVCSVDYDFLIRDFTKFNSLINNSNWDVIVQSKEVAPSFHLNYNYALKNFINLFKKDFFKDYPEFLYFDSYNYTYNCGFYGFKNVELMKDFTSKTIRLYEILTEKKLIQNYYDSNDLFSQRHDYLETLNINCILPQFFLTIWSSYNNIYVKEINPLKEWEKFNPNNQKMNNYQNDTSAYMHFAARDKNNFLKKEFQDLFNYLINN